MSCKHCLFVAFAALITCAADAKAGGVQPLFVSGVITQDPVAEQSTTIDTYGLFGPAGTDLAKQAITVFVQYVPRDFKKSYYGSGAYFYDNKLSNDRSGAISIVVTVGSTQRVFAPASTGPSSTGEIEISDGRGNPIIIFKISSAQDPSVSVSYGLTSLPTFGMPIVPATLVGTPDRTTFVATVSGRNENLTFQASSHAFPAGN